jgi:hypothetical protein
MVSDWKRQAMEGLFVLREMTIDQPNQVWCADIAYIPVRRGFLDLSR